MHATHVKERCAETIGGSVCESNTPETSRRCLSPVLKNTVGDLTEIENLWIYSLIQRFTRRGRCYRCERIARVLNKEPSQFHHTKTSALSRLRFPLSELGTSQAPRGWGLCYVKGAPQESQQQTRAAFNSLRSLQNELHLCRCQVGRWKHPEPCAEENSNIGRTRMRQPQGAVLLRRCICPMLR